MIAPIHTQTRKSRGKLQTWWRRRWTSPPYLGEKHKKVWSENRLSCHLEEVSPRACVPHLHVANWRQISVAIVKAKSASRVACFDPDEGDEDAEEMDATIEA
jgi:hypothetical protein